MGVGRGRSRGGPNATGPDASRRARFLPLRFIKNIILNVFPGDEGLQEVPPMHRVLKCLHTSNPIHCSSLHGQLSPGVQERGGPGWLMAKKCVYARVSVWRDNRGPSLVPKDPSPPSMHFTQLLLHLLTVLPPPSFFTWAGSLWTPASPNEDPWLHFHFWSHIRHCQAQNRPVSSEAWRAG